MLPHATRRDDVAGNKQVYGGVRTYKRYVGSASGSASLLRVHGHPDKLHCLTYPLMKSPNGSARCLTTNGH